MSSPAESKKPKHLFLHIGRGKTGSSALQAFLTNNRAALLERGMHYLVSADVGAGFGHANFAKSFIDHPPDYMHMPADLRPIQARVAAEIAALDATNILLSSENFTLANVERVFAFLVENCRATQVTIIFFARSQDEVAESQYNQMVKHAGARLPFSEYVERALDEVDYGSLLQPWAKAFGKENIIARVYDAARESIIEDFLASLPISAGPPPFAPPPLAVNESVGYFTLEIFRRLNAFDLPERRTLYSSLQKAMKQDDLPALFFSSAEARRFRSRFADSNRAFLHEYLGVEGNDLGGRRYSDEERDSFRDQIGARAAAISA